MTKERREEDRREEDTVHKIMLDAMKSNYEHIQQIQEDIKQLISETVTKVELTNHADDEMKFGYRALGVIGTIIIIAGTWFYNHEQADISRTMDDIRTQTETSIELQGVQENQREIKESLKEIVEKLVIVLHY